MDTEENRNYTYELASFIAETNVPGEVRHTARRYLLDWLGSAIGGGGSEPASIARKVADILGGNQSSTIIASGKKTSAPLAAFCNATASHVIEMDDLDRTSITHPAAPVIACALSIAEQYELSGEELLDGIAIGYEVCVRVGEALGPTHYEYWHTTGTAGTAGAAAAAARLLGLNIKQSAHTLGSAGTMAAGLWEFLSDGAMSKQLHPAKAAHDGALAALLASEGFTGASHIFEGKKGILNAMSRAPRPNMLTDNLEHLAERSDVWKINFVSFKVHSSCRHTHAAVDGAIRIADSNSFEITDIADVKVEIYSQALGLLDGVEPVTPWAAKFSLPFCVATALRYKDCTPSRFTEETILDETTLALAEKISFDTKEDLDSMYPAAWPSRVMVRLQNGASYETQVDYPAGDPETDVTTEQLSEKFRSLAYPYLEHNTDSVIELVMQRTYAPKARELTDVIGHK